MKKILVIYSEYKTSGKSRQTLYEHLKALNLNRRKYKTTYFNAATIVPSSVHFNPKRVRFPTALLRKKFDVVLLHYTFLSTRTIGIHFPRWKRQFAWIKEIDALKIAIPQDEGWCAGVLDLWLYELGVSVVVSVHYSPNGFLYPLMRQVARFYSCLPGYIDISTAQRYQAEILPLKQREKDIVYRARRLPLFFGKGGRLKSLIADKFLIYPRSKKYQMDVTTSLYDFIPGTGWFDFLASGKATLGAQGGYTMIDWFYEIRSLTEELCEEKKDKGQTLCLKDLESYMPAGWDDYELLTITPRHFHSIMLKTAMILVRGYYKGILQPDLHYIPVDEDFSNLDEVWDKFDDTESLQRMVDRNYEEFYLNGKYTYDRLSDIVDRAINESEQHPISLSRNQIDAIHVTRKNYLENIPSFKKAVERDRFRKKISDLYQCLTEDWKYSYKQSSVPRFSDTGQKSCSNSSTRQIDLLFFCDKRNSQPARVLNEINAFESFSGLRIHFFNPRNVKQSLFLDLKEFDGVVIHSSLPVFEDLFMHRFLREKMIPYKGLKVLFDCNGYRRWDHFVTFLQETGIDILFSACPADEIQTRYGFMPRVKVQPMVKAYVPSRVSNLSRPLLKCRPITVGHRSMGNHAAEADLFQNFFKRVPGDFKCDFQQHGAEIGISGMSWYDFLSNCRTFLETASDPLVDGNEAGVRIIDAAACKTALILLETDDSGIMQPWEHYIPLKKDFSNFEQVIEKIKDTDFLQKIVDKTYETISLPGRYSCQSFINRFDNLVSEGIVQKGFRKRNGIRKYPWALLETDLLGSGCREKLLMRGESAKEVYLKVVTNFFPNCNSWSQKMLTNEQLIACERHAYLFLKGNYCKLKKLTAWARLRLKGIFLFFKKRQRNVSTEAERIIPNPRRKS